MTKRNDVKPKSSTEKPKALVKSKKSVTKKVPTKKLTRAKSKRSLPNKRAGRPSKLTKVRAEKICEELKLGMTYTGASALSGITRQTLDNWKNIGRQMVDKVENKQKLLKSEEKYFDFFYAILNAEAEAERRMTEFVNDAAPNNWQAAKWWLETRRKEDYSPKQEVEHSGNIDSNLKIDIATLHKLAEE